jgi:hypothetical protein
MKKTLAVIISLFAVSVAFAQDARTELIQSLKTSGVAEDLDSSPDGIAIRLLPDGGFQIFSMGTGVYDFDDPEDIADARKEAEMKAKANLSKFMNESLSSEESFDQLSAKVKTLNSENGETTSSVEKTTVKTTFETIRSSSSALLKGVVVLASEKVPGGGSSGTYRVQIGVSSKTIAARNALTNGPKTGPAKQPAATSAGSSASNAGAAAGSTSNTGAAAAGSASNAGVASNAGMPPVVADEPGLPEGWIVCIGNGRDRKAAVLAALLEGIQQVYGLSLEQDAKYKKRMERIRLNTDVAKLTSKEMEENTMTLTAGFVKEYRIVDVRNLDPGTLEAKIYARITNPRAGGAVALMICRPQMRPDKMTLKYEVGPKKRLSGNELADEVGKIIGQAFSGINKFIVLDEADLANLIKQQDLTKDMVDAGLSPSQELLKTGQLLTADFILTSEIEDIKYSKTLTQDKTTKKFGPEYKMSIRLKYKLTNATTGESLLDEPSMTVQLSDEEIKGLLEEDEDADLLFALLRKVSETIGGKVPVQ